MLKAILHGKAGRIGSAADESVSWRELFKKREDLLTAVFFGRLLYLSHEVRQYIVSLMLGSADTVQELGRLHDVVFWEKLRRTNRTGYVEPDVLLICEAGVVVIEVKPPFGGPQSTEQWEQQIHALLAQGGEFVPRAEHLPIVHFVALGNNAANWQKHADMLRHDCTGKDVPIHALEWERLADGLQAVPHDLTATDAAVVDDLRDALYLFGIEEPRKPFSDLLGYVDMLREGDVAAWQIVAAVGPERVEVDASIEWAPLFDMSSVSNLEIRLWM